MNMNGHSYAYTVNHPAINKKSIVYNIPIQRETNLETFEPYNNAKQPLPQRATVQYHESEANKKAIVHPAPLVKGPHLETNRENEIETFSNAKIDPRPSEISFPAPDLSRDTLVNTISLERSNMGQGMTRVEPNAEVYNATLVLEEQERNLDLL